MLQAAPVGEALFQTYDLRKVFDLQSALGARGVPVAPMRWYEASPELLGAPFYVMDRVSGLVPADRPSYHAEGFLTELDPATRERMWWSGLSAMARVHAIDPRTIGVDLGPLDDPVGARLDHWTQFVAWASPDRLPYFDEAMDWLRRNRPYPTAPPSIVWGDAKLSNILFEDGEARALLDWELCTVGPAEDDLAHWLWLDHHSAMGAGRRAGCRGFPIASRRRPGTPSNSAAISRRRSGGGSTPSCVCRRWCTGSCTSCGRSAACRRTPTSGRRIR